MSLVEQLSFDSATERDKGWSERAAAYVVKLSPGVLLTSDVLRTMVGDPEGSGCSVGALFRRMEKSGLLAYTGRDVLSSRPAARGRYLRVWQRQLFIPERAKAAAAAPTTQSVRGGDGPSGMAASGDTGAHRPSPGEGAGTSKPETPLASPRATPGESAPSREEATE